jgi:4-hydroxybenzoate polyprenyltransferase/phosphoserine phosphatase
MTIELTTPERSSQTPGPGSLASRTHIPLCVDLDGTLLRTDTLHEAAVSAVFSDWTNLWRIPLWLARGRAVLKRELAQRWRFDPARLPYNDKLLEKLRAEKVAGRRIVLVTAADEAIARPIAEHLALFDDVFASDGIVNLRGGRKADLLCSRFGEKGFDYAGNDSTDHAVWKRASGVIAVNANPSVKRAAARRYPGAITIDERRNALTALLRAMRPYQWVKNIFVLVPLFTSGGLDDAAAWTHSLVALAAFCAIASSIYLLNDISDISADRAHARKRNRPFANGTLGIVTGLIASPFLAIAGAVLAIASGAWPAVGIYAVLSLAYTARLKEMPLIDVFILAALYTLRLEGGGQASGHPVSLWLLGFSSFLFLGLALIKRVAELDRLRLAGRIKAAARRGYDVRDIQALQMFGIGATFASSVVLSLYIQSQTAEEIYRRPQFLWFLIPLLLFWQCRLWLSTARGYMHDDPIVYTARDWVSWIVFASVGIVTLAARGTL